MVDLNGEQNKARQRSESTLHHESHKTTMYVISRINFDLKTTLLISVD